MTVESNLEKILGLLRSGDPRELEQAVHPIQSLGDPSILAHALSGTEYDAKTMILHPGPAFRRSRESLLQDHLAVARLLSASTSPYRTDVKALRLSGSADRQFIELHLGCLSDFPNLHTLSIVSDRKRLPDLAPLGLHDSRREPHRNSHRSLGATQPKHGLSHSEQSCHQPGSTGRPRSPLCWLRSESG